MSEQTTFTDILTETDGNVRIIRLNRPKALNALRSHLMRELGEALAVAEADDAIGAIVLAGSERAFAAGADIKEMIPLDYAEAYNRDFITAEWESLARVRKPVIAAVRGFALGGGCEVAMMCDMIFAGESAKFGQPEITIGTIPGAGGTQRLARWVGKAKAMDLVLTGRMMGAEEAERAGLVARILPDEELEGEAIKAAQKISGFSRPVVMIAKESVNRAFESTLSEGVRFERRVFHSTFALEDRKEGMSAFAEKRAPDFRHR